MCDGHMWVCFKRKIADGSLWTCGYLSVLGYHVGAWGRPLTKTIGDLRMVVYWSGNGVFPNGIFRNIRAIYFTISINVDVTMNLMLTLQKAENRSILPTIIIFVRQSWRISDIICRIISRQNPYNNGWISSIITYLFTDNPYGWKGAVVCDYAFFVVFFCKLKAEFLPQGELLLSFYGV